jgi:hypothetical protein
MLLYKTMNIETGRYISGEAATTKSLEQLAIELAELDPRPVSHFTPDNLDQTMEDFLSGASRNPDDATYSKLDSLDFESREAQYRSILTEIESHPGIPPSYLHVYEDYVARTIGINSLMLLAVRFRTAQTDEERQEAKQAFKKLNSELYGDPEPEVASLMVKEIADDTAEVEDQGVARIRSEFLNLLPESLLDLDRHTASLKPSGEAKDFVANFVDYMHGPLLRHVEKAVVRLSEEKQINKNKLKVGAEDIAAIFQTIIDEEFPESGWKAVLRKANAINVVASTKEVIVPEDRRPVTPEQLRGLVVHELGVHMLRSIIGEGSDLIPQRFGFAGVGEAEEGLAKISESAIVEDTSRTGYQHYLTATLLNQGYDFRNAFEVMWRYKVLDAYLDKPVDEINEDYINKQKKTAFKFMFRSVRGTNELPWHVPLNYFNGTHKIWEYIEEHKDSPEMVTLLFLGKIDPTKPNHVRGALDARSRM